MLPGRRGDFPEGFMAHMAPFLFRALAMAAPLALLAACDSSQRFGGYMPGGNSLARSAQASPPPPLTAAPLMMRIRRPCRHLRVPAPWREPRRFRRRPRRA
jgi:hypothetical protein